MAKTAHAKPPQFERIAVAAVKKMVQLKMARTPEQDRDDDASGKPLTFLSVDSPSRRRGNPRGDDNGEGDA
jgi:hypothetical protein